MTVEKLSAYRLEQAEERIGELSQKLAAMEIKFEKRERERSVEESRKLWAGITFLGGIVMTLLGVLWTFRGVIFRGDQP